MKVFEIAGAVFALPHLLLLLGSKARSDVLADVRRWVGVEAKVGVTSTPKTAFWFLRLMGRCEEFRSLFYYRVPVARLFSWPLRPAPTLFFDTPKIGGGLFIQHGFATIIHAREIGENCWINQQVTIGSGRGGRPRLGNGVTVRAGAKVFGGIDIGDNVRIGANAVVTKDVPADCTVAGVPARIIKRAGARVDEAL